MKKLTKPRYLERSVLLTNLKMKLSLLFLLASLFKINANTYSQTTRITIALEKVTLQKALDEIQKNTEFKFLVDPSEINLKRIVSLNEKNKKIEPILNKLFASTAVEYTILNKQIVLKMGSMWPGFYVARVLCVLN